MFITGKVIAVEERSVGQSGLIIKQLVVQSENVHPDFPQQIPIDFLKEKIKLVDDVQLNDIVNVSVILRGYISQSGNRGVNILGVTLTKI